MSDPIDAFRTFCGEEDQWKPSKEADGVKVFSRTVEGSSLNVARGIVTVKATVDQCFEYAMDASVRTSWDKMMKEARIVRTTDDGHTIAYMQSIPKWPASARDFVIDLYHKRFDDGTIVVLGKTPEAEEVPPVNGVVRGKAINSGYMFAPNADGTTTVTYIMQRLLSSYHHSFFFVVVVHFLSCLLFIYSGYGWLARYFYRQQGDD